MSRRNRFVSTETVRLDLSDGDFVEVKERLSYGESQALSSSSLVNKGGVLELDMGRFSVNRLEKYITDWSFVDAKGKSVPVTRAAIERLHPATADEIQAALNIYESERESDPNDKLIAETPSKAK